ncbi:hypothetical protein [Streptomyces buecherae]|uniref:hypothetical protein n=1 Tax=Streptomyces buecherae TaxID=2763006 RepID=UPI001E550E22|nr:hypothetical protein [Streptomyces buecherae]
MPRPAAAQAAGGAATARRVIRGAHWRGELRFAVGLAALLLAALLLVDLANGTLDAARGLCWAGLSLLLLAVLVPPRVTAGEGWLATRGVWRTRSVRTDLLVTVRLVGGVTPRLLLRDARGATVWINPRALVTDPALWRQVERGARMAQRRRVLRGGAWLLAELGRRAAEHRPRAPRPGSAPP